MIAFGAGCAVAATVALWLGVQRGSAVQRRLALLAPPFRAGSRWHPVDDRDLRQAALLRTQTELAAAKCLGAGLGAIAGGASGVVLIAAGLGYAGFVLPSLVIERRARSRRRQADLALGPLLERLEALAAAGRPIEHAIVALAAVPTSSAILDGALRRAADAYALGAPPFGALADVARLEGVRGLAALASSLERSRGLGHGSIAVIRDARDAARAAERAASLEAASKVEGKLMATLVLCYLPALMLLVVIPLFLTLLSGLFG
jgi:pilus assembly protein TadC